MVLRLLGLGGKSAAADLKPKLPLINAFVDLGMTGGGPRGSVCVESIHDKRFAVSLLAGVTPGATGVFHYQNPLGKFRFTAKCLAVGDAQAVFEIPETINTLQIFSGAHTRAAVRIETTVAAQWRYAPRGQRAGDFRRGSLTDVSRSGASLIVDREVKTGTFVETRFVVSTANAPLLLLGEVVRSAVIETSKKISLGLRFHGVKPEEDRAIMEFIYKRQADRRNRGLA